MATPAEQRHREAVGPGEGRSGMHAQRAGRERGHVLSHDNVRHWETLKEAVRHHVAGAGAGFLGGLEHCHDGSGPSREVGAEQRGRTEEAGDVDVVAARMHHGYVGSVGTGAPRRAGVAKPRLFQDRKAVHVRTEHHCGSVPVPQDTHDAGPADSGADLPAQPGEPFGHDPGGPDFGSGQLGMLVQVLVNSGEVLCHRGNVVQNLCHDSPYVRVRLLCDPKPGGRRSEGRRPGVHRPQNRRRMR